jgi:hypothetical protein
MAEPWFPRSTPDTVAASNAAAQQAALDEIAQSTDATEQALLAPSVLPIGGATEATQQANQAALGTEGGGVVVPPPGGATGILGWIRSLREYFQEMYSIVGAQRAIKVDVIQTVAGGGGGGDATAANQMAGNASLTSIGGKIPALVGGRIPVVLPAGGSGLTDTELRAVPVPVSGTVATGGLTDAQLRAVPVPVSGTVTTGGLTDAQLRASDVPVAVSSLPKSASSNVPSIIVAGGDVIASNASRKAWAYRTWGRTPCMYEWQQVRQARCSILLWLAAMRAMMDEAGPFRTMSISGLSVPLALLHASPSTSYDRPSNDPGQRILAQGADDELYRRLSGQ